MCFPVFSKTLVLGLCMLKVFRRCGRNLVVARSRSSCLLVSRSLPSSPDLGGFGFLVVSSFFRPTPPRYYLWGIKLTGHRVNGMKLPQLPGANGHYQYCGPVELSSITLAIGISISITIGMPSAISLIISIKPSQKKSVWHYHHNCHQRCHCH